VGPALEIVISCKHTILHLVCKEFVTPIVSLLIALARMYVCNMKQKII
jgi:hypothetical protein